MITNEDGTEYFHYLQFEHAGPKEEAGRFTRLLKDCTYPIGTKLQIEYSPTEEIHTFIVCLPGHTLDPANPDVRTLPVIEVCGMEKIPS